MEARKCLLVSLCIFLFLFIVGCTEQTQQVNPVINEPVVEEQLQEPEEEVIFEEYLTIHRIKGGKQNAYLYYEDKRAALINCGETIYAPIVVDKLNKIFDENENLIFNNIIITNTSKNYIGGCKDIIVDFPDLRRVDIYDNATEDKEYTDIIFWTRKEKLNIDEDFIFNLSYNNYIINLSNITTNTVITNGTEFIPQ